MSLSVWDLPVTTRPEFDDFEAAPCTSVYWLPLGHVHHGASLRCALDAEHRLDPSDSRHGRGLTRWTTEQAALSLADFGPRPAAQCSDCTSPAATRGLCAACAGRELACDDREVIEV
jgi:hypothetical protein